MSINYRLRLLLSHVRGADYAHVGEEESIDLALNFLSQYYPEIKTGNILDIGCGFGGTANYFNKHEYHNIVGIDIDSLALQYAQTHYQNISFHQLNAFEIDQVYKDIDLVYMYNVIYAINDKKLLLSKIKNIMKPGGVLIIFDYSHNNECISHNLRGFDGTLFNPISTRQFVVDLEEAGFKLIKIKDLTKEFIHWYQVLLGKIESALEELQQNFTDEEINRVTKTWENFIEQMQENIAGGVIIYAEALS